MKFSTLLFSLFVVVVTSSCETRTLKVHKLTDTDSQSRKGFVYPLLFTQFEIKITRRILSCVRSVDEDGTQLTPPLPNVRAYVGAEISAENMDDAENMYLIDSDSLSGTTKISDLIVKWEKGRLVSINATADDQSAEIISSVVSGIGKLAVSSINPVAGVPALPDPGKDVVLCNTTTATAVSNVVILEKEIASVSEKISGLAQDITALQSDLAKIGLDSQIDCSIQGNSGEIKCQLKAAMAELKSQGKQLDTAKRKLSHSLKAISIESIYRWPSNSKTSKTDTPFRVSDEILKNWVHLGKVKGVENIASSQQSIDNFKKELDIFFQLGKVGNYGVNNLKTYSDRLGADAGIRYRLPANGYVVVCKKKICTRDDKPYVVAVKKGEIHQLGHIFNVPFVSKPFTNIELKMTFDSDGLPTMASMSQKESAGENIAGVFKHISEEVANIRKVKEESKKSELDKIKDQTALLTAQSELATAQSALNPSESTSLLSELKLKTELAEAQKKYLDALEALEPELLQEVDQNEEAISVIRGETALIQAEAARLEALLALNNARQALNEN